MMATSSEYQGLLRSFKFCFSFLMLFVGFCVVGFGSTLISLIMFYHVRNVIPMFYPVATHPLLHFFSLFIAAFIATGLWVNFFGSIGTEPGYLPPAYKYEPERGGVGSLLARHGLAYNRTLTVKRCLACGVDKCPRAHHCFLCARCVRKMDHHCPWINNCIGYYNQRYFFCFLVYLWLGALYCLAHCAIILLSTAQNCPFQDFPGAPCPRINRFGQSGLKSSKLFVFSFILCIALSAVLIVFIAWFLFLIFTDQTSIEYQINLGVPSAHTPAAQWVDVSTLLDARARWASASVLHPRTAEASWNNFCTYLRTESDSSVATSLRFLSSSVLNQFSRLGKLKYYFRICAAVVLLGGFLLLPSLQRAPSDGTFFVRWGDIVV